MTSLNITIDLAPARAAAVAEVNTITGEVRKRFITAIPAQDMTYLRKEQEAERYLGLDPPPSDLSGFPFLAAEIGITAPSALELATLWKTMATQFAQVGAALETLRLGTIAQIETAASPAAIRGHVETFKSALATF